MAAARDPRTFGDVARDVIASIHPAERGRVTVPKDEKWQALLTGNRKEDRIALVRVMLDWVSSHPANSSERVQAAAAVMMAGVDVAKNHPSEKFITTIAAKAVDLLSAKVFRQNPLSAHPLLIAVRKLERVLRAKDTDECRANIKSVQVALLAAEELAAAVVVDASSHECAGSRQSMCASCTQSLARAS
jgi:hypothetical protein